MSQMETIRTDLDFTRSLMEGGGDTLQACYQCATCSVVCKLSEDGSPFPRKEMIWAQWGLKDRLVKDPDIWLCHHCGDCSNYCPRGARPGDVLNQARKEAIKHYAWPSFMGQWVNEPKNLPLMFIVPLALILLVVITVTKPINELLAHEVHYADLFPHIALNLFFPAALGIALLGSIIGAARFWKDIEHIPITSNAIDRKALLRAAKESFITVVKHDRFHECEENNVRYKAHMIMFAGFLVLFALAGVAVIGVLLDAYPFGLFNPIKILGNVAAALVMVGAGLLIKRRWDADPADNTSTFFDWLLLYDLFAVGATGLLVEAFRFLNTPVLAYPTYIIHLTAVFVLLIYFPYSKFAHIVYRMTAMVHQRYRELKAQTA